MKLPFYILVDWVRRFCVSEGRVIAVDVSCVAKGRVGVVQTLIDEDVDHCGFADTDRLVIDEDVRPAARQRATSPKTGKIVKRASGKRRETAATATTAGTEENAGKTMAEGELSGLQLSVGK